MEKSASECDGGTSAPKKTVYMRRDSNPDGQKSSQRLVAAEPPVLIKEDNRYSLYTACGFARLAFSGLPGEGKAGLMY